MYREGMVAYRHMGAFVCTGGIWMYVDIEMLPLLTTPYACH